MPPSDLRSGVAREHVLARVAVGSLIVVSMLDLGVAAGHLFRLWLIGRIRGHAPDAALARGSDAFMVLVGLAALVFFVLTAVVFLMWLHAAYRNLALAGPHALETTPGWAVGAYFIPIANLYYPYSVMKELRLRSADGNASESRVGPGAPWGVRLWWIAFLVSNIAGWIGLFLSKGTPPLDALERSSWTLMAAMVLRVVGAAFLIGNILSIDRMQRGFERPGAPVA